MNCKSQNKLLTLFCLTFSLSMQWSRWECSWSLPSQHKSSSPSCLMSDLSWVMRLLLSRFTPSSPSHPTTVTLGAQTSWGAAHRCRTAGEVLYHPVQSSSSSFHCSSSSPHPVWKWIPKTESRVLKLHCHPGANPFCSVLLPEHCCLQKHTHKNG